MEKKIYIIAGEASGDFIGSKLISYLRHRNQDIKFRFIGGDLMHKEFNDSNNCSFFHMSKISIMGIIEILFHIIRIKKLINNTVEDIKKFNPDIVITIDSLGFNKRVVAKIKKHRELKQGFRNTKLVHYVAPTVWAWKPSRAKKISTIYDYLLCLFDFEVPYFTAHGLKTYAVGHPIVESGADKGEARRFITKYSLVDNKKYILVMPGSRISEVSRLLPIFSEVIRNIKKKYPKVEVVIPTLSHLSSYIHQYLKDNELKFTVITDYQDKYDAFALSDLALVASGTATLELSIARVPSVVGYKVNYITSKIVSILVKIKYASIINIIANQEIIPEFIQEKCNVKNITVACLNILNKQQDNITNHNTKIVNILENLGYNKFIPSEKAGKIIENILYNKD